MSCGVGCRHGWDPALQWLWCRPVATARIRPLAGEPPYAEGAAQEKGKNKQTNKQKKQKNLWLYFHLHFLKIKKNFFFGCARGMWDFLGQESHPSHSSDNARSLTTRPLRQLYCFFIFFKIPADTAQPGEVGQVKTIYFTGETVDSKEMDLPASIPARKGQSGE